MKDELCEKDSRVLHYSSLLGKDKLVQTLCNYVMLNASTGV